MLFRARMAVTFFTLLLALLVFLAAQEMFGTGARFIALGLLVFDPNLLAHGAVVGTDVGLSCFTFASVYAFYRYVKAPSPWRLIVVGSATGLALICKHTGILVFPMLFLLAIWEVWRGARTTAPSAAPVLPTVPPIIQPTIPASAAIYSCLPNIFSLVVFFWHVKRDVRAGSGEIRAARLMLFAHQGSNAA
jgi:dolichyl-phosphate-mannose--protein O-mannosyl transferase